MTEQRLRKIGEAKATHFKKDFDKIYDFWKDKALYDLGYEGELKFIKEHNKVFIYIILDYDSNLDQVDDYDLE